MDELVEEFELGEKRRGQYEEEAGGVKPPLQSVVLCYYRIIYNSRLSPLAGGGARGGSDGAVAAFAFLEIEEGFEEAGAIEVWPESFYDKDFGVGDLPEKEIADAHFAAGADQKIGIG